MTKLETKELAELRAEVERLTALVNGLCAWKESMMQTGLGEPNAPAIIITFQWGSIPSLNETKKLTRFAQSKDTKTRRKQGQVLAMQAVSEYPEFQIIMPPEKVRLELHVFSPDLKGLDLGNYDTKATEDGCNGVIWQDDRQIKQRYQEAHLDRDNPRIEMHIYKIKEG